MRVKEEFLNKIGNKGMCNFCEFNQKRGTWIIVIKEVKGELSGSNWGYYCMLRNRNVWWRWWCRWMEEDKCGTCAEYHN